MLMEWNSDKEEYVDVLNGEGIFYNSEENIYELTNDSVIYYHGSEGEVFETKTGNKLYYTNYNEGKFAIKETKSAEGYKLSYDIREFTLNDRNADDNIVYMTDLENGMINYPNERIHTKASYEGQNIIDREGYVRLQDTVYYENLQPGKKYEIRGKLVDYNTGEELVNKQGILISGKRTFITEDYDGEENVDFYFNVEELGTDRFVVFEELYLIEGEEEIFITGHEDIEDRNQTIEIETPEETTEETTETTTEETSSENETESSKVVKEETTSHTETTETTETFETTETTETSSEMITSTTKPVKKVIENNPKTGDTSSVGVLILIACMFAGIAIVCGVKGKDADNE